MSARIIASLFIQNVLLVPTGMLFYVRLLRWHYDVITGPVIVSGTIYTCKKNLFEP